MNGTRSKPLVTIRSYEDRNSGKEPAVVQQTINERLSILNQREATATQEKSSTPVSRKGSNVSVLSPPPPPPLPVETDEVDNLKSPIPPKQKTKAPPPPVPQKIASTTFNQPPPCPTPDYDTLSISSTATLPKKSSVNGYIKKELKHSNSHNGYATPSETETPSQKLPNGYFRPKSIPMSPSSQNGIGSNSTLTKQRPVSVIIGEYPSGTSRKQPKKLEFLNNGRETRESPRRSPHNDSIVSQFASELAQTLNRSNLRKKTESMENLLNLPQIKANSNGSVRISVNSNLLNRHLAKSTNDLSSLDASLFNDYHPSNGIRPVSNRVTISIPSNERKSFEATPSGILKHNNVLGGNLGGSQNSPSSHRSVLHQKSITFGEIPTVINEKSLHVT